MDQSLSSIFVGVKTVRTGRTGTIKLLLYTDGARERGEPEADATDRQIIPKASVLWVSTNDCVDALEQALDRGPPGIFNTDQGSQFTSDDFTGRLKDAEIQISMDGRGRATDNIFIERLWRSVKYEDIYLRDYIDGTET